MSNQRDGYRTSSVLTQARTILSSAETGLDRIKYCNGTSDPAYSEVKAILEEIVEKLEPYRRLGKTKG